MGGTSAGYIWLSFSWEKIESEVNYLLCAHGSWDMNAPPSSSEPCYTFDLIPDAAYTPNFQAPVDYDGKLAPYIASSCGFAICPGWPLSAADNTADSACCEKLGDALTQAKYVGACNRDTLCGGTCKETEFGNIPGGHGGCSRKDFDPSKANIIGETDCTKPRGASGGVVDACRGEHSLPRFFEYTV